MTDEECATFNKIIENKPKKPRVRL
jgi:hypothetical protein